MISRLHIKKYKCLKDEDMEFRPLTVLTGTNSSGKSSVLQAVLLLARNCNPKNRDRMYELISEYQELACDASLTLDGTEYRYSTDSDKNSDADILRWEDSLYFLTANRVGPESVAKMSKEYKVGNNGEFLLGTFFLNMNNHMPIFKSQEDVELFIKEYGKYFQIQSINNPTSEEFKFFIFSRNKGSFTNCMALWLSYISGTSLILAASSLPHILDKTSVFFIRSGIPASLSPSNLGSGMSYLAKVLILCFLAKPGDVVMIENPEIHLHPRAQSRLGEFFAFMAGKGIQLVIETHCEHLLSSLRYQVYKDRLRSDDVILYYKADDKTPFEQLRISKNGRYMNREGKQCGFPKGFFDVSVRQLMEIG